jgi:hypothetical protein
MGKMQFKLTGSCAKLPVITGKTMQLPQNRLKTQRNFTMQLK